MVYYVGQVGAVAQGELALARGARRRRLGRGARAGGRGDSAAGGRGGFAGGGGGRGRGGVEAGGGFVGALVLLHVVFAGEGFVAGRAQDVLLPRVLLAVAGGVARGGEGVATRVPRGVRAGVFFLDRLRGRGRGGRGGRGRRRRRRGQNRRRDRAERRRQRHRRVGARVR